MYRVKVIQERARLQIQLYSQTSLDILHQMDMTQNLIMNKVTENKRLSRSFPHFLMQMDSISHTAKKQVVAGLMQVYKFQHTIQILRWVGSRNQNKYDVEGWESISNAIGKRMDMESGLISEMQNSKEKI